MFLKSLIKGEIRSLNIQKAHGPDDISIHMIKICDSALVKPHSLIFQNCFKCSTFPDIWKKSDICLVHTKNDKQVINNYRPNICPVYKKMTNKLLTVTDLLHYCLYLGKYLKSLSLNLNYFLSTLSIMNENSSQNINPVSGQMIHEHIN